MAYSLESLSDGCYENSSVLINKFDIRDQKLLDKIEQSITSALIAKAFVEIPFTDADFKFYKSLHKYVFSDIYDWAGKIRTVNMSKKGTDFCKFKEIEENGIRIFNRLKNTNYLKTLQGEAFIDEFTDIFCELNYLHPFREGNGRVQRLFLTMLLKTLNKKLDFSRIDKDLFMIATIKSVSGDVFMLKDIFLNNIEQL